MVDVVGRREVPLEVVDGGQHEHAAGDVREVHEVQERGWLFAMPWRQKELDLNEAAEVPGSSEKPQVRG